MKIKIIILEGFQCETDYLLYLMVITIQLKVYLIASGNIQQEPHIFIYLKLVIILIPDRLIKNISRLNKQQIHRLLLVEFKTLATFALK